MNAYELPSQAGLPDISPFFHGAQQQQRQPRQSSGSGQQRNQSSDKGLVGANVQKDRILMELSQKEENFANEIMGGWEEAQAKGQSLMDYLRDKTPEAARLRSEIAAIRSRVHAAADRREQDAEMRNRLLKDKNATIRGTMRTSGHGAKEGFGEYYDEQEGQFKAGWKPFSQLRRLYTDSDFVRYQEENEEENVYGVKGGWGTAYDPNAGRDFVHKFVNEKLSSSIETQQNVSSPGYIQGRKDNFNAIREGIREAFTSAGQEEQLALMNDAVRSQVFNPETGELGIPMYHYTVDNNGEIVRVEQVDDHGEQIFLNPFENPTLAAEEMAKRHAYAAAAGRQEIKTVTMAEYRSGGSGKKEDEPEAFFTGLARSVGNFTRNLFVTTDVDTIDISASLKNIGFQIKDQRKLKEQQIKYNAFAENYPDLSKDQLWERFQAANPNYIQEILENTDTIYPVTGVYGNNSWAFYNALISSYNKNNDTTSVATEQPELLETIMQQAFTGQVVQEAHIPARYLNNLKAFYNNRATTKFAAGGKIWDTHAIRESANMPPMEFLGTGYTGMTIDTDTGPALAPSVNAYMFVTESELDNLTVRVQQANGQPKEVRLDKVDERLAFELDPNNAEHQSYIDKHNLNEGMYVVPVLSYILHPNAIDQETEKAKRQGVGEEWERIEVERARREQEILRENVDKVLSN